MRSLRAWTTDELTSIIDATPWRAVALHPTADTRPPNNAHDREDLLGTVRLHLYDRASQIMGANNPGGYVVTTARHCAIDWIRADARRREWFVAEQCDEIPATPTGGTDPRYTAEAVANGIEHLAALRALPAQPTMSRPATAPTPGNERGSEPSGGKRDCDRGLDGNPLLLFRADLLRAIDNLPEQQRRAVLLRGDEHFSYERIDRALHLRNGRAREWLRTEIPKRIAATWGEVL